MTHAYIISVYSVHSSRFHLPWVDDTFSYIISRVVALVVFHLLSLFIVYCILFVHALTNSSMSQ